jgi:hypothetical protein
VQLDGDTAHRFRHFVEAVLLHPFRECAAVVSAPSRIGSGDLKSMGFPTASAAPIDFHASNVSALPIAVQASRPRLMVRCSMNRMAVSSMAGCCASSNDSFGNVTGTSSRSLPRRPSAICGEQSHVLGRPRCGRLCRPIAVVISAALANTHHASRRRSRPIARLDAIERHIPAMQHRRRGVPDFRLLPVFAEIGDVWTVRAVHCCRWASSH